MEQRNREVRIHNVKPSTIAAFGASFGAIAGLVIAFVAWIDATMAFSDATASLIQGLLLGLGTGVLTLIIVPLVYAAIGWVVGYVQALIFNLVISASGGITLSVADGPEPAEAAQPLASETAAESEDYTDEQAANPMPAGQRDQPAFGETIGPRRRM